MAHESMNGVTSLYGLFVFFTLGLAREHDLFGFDWTVVRFD
jgi:hypothetical protein